MTIPQLIENHTGTGFSFEVLPPLKGKGISQLFKNIDSLKAKQPEDINRLYCELMAESEFSAEGLQDGLSSTEKVKGRILKSIEVFNRG